MRLNVLVVLESDLYVMIGQVVDEVALRLSPFPMKNDCILKLLDAIFKCIQAYVNALERICCEKLHQDMAEVLDNGTSCLFGWSRAVYIQVKHYILVLFFKSEDNLPKLSFATSTSTVVFFNSRWHMLAV